MLRRKWIRREMKWRNDDDDIEDLMSMPIKA